MISLTTPTKKKCREIELKMTIKNKSSHLKGWKLGHFSLTASVSLTSLSLCCSLMSPLLRILVLPQSRGGGRCLRSLVPVISGGVITREMFPPYPTLLLSVPVSPTISLFPSSRFPPAAALHTPLSRLRRAHHGDGVWSACVRTNTHALSHLLGR